MRNGTDSYCSSQTKKTNSAWNNLQDILHWTGRSQPVCLLLSNFDIQSRNLCAFYPLPPSPPALPSLFLPLSVPLILTSEDHAENFTQSPRTAVGAPVLRANMLA